MEDLYELGYDAGQISQIYKIQKLGINIEKSISINTTTEQLRTLYNMLNDDKYTKKQKKTIAKFFTEKNKDVRYLIDKGFELACQIHLAMEAEEESISLDPMSNKGYDFLQMKEILKYLKKGVDVTKLIDNNIPVEKGFLLEKFHLDTIQIYKDYTEKKIAAICYWLEKNINVMPYIKTSYSQYQISSIGKALYKKLDVEKVKTHDLPGTVMDVIIGGLEEGVDITPHLTPTTTTQCAKSILDCLKKGSDVKILFKYKDLKFSKLAMKLSSEKIDDSFIDETADYEKMKFLVQTAIDAKECPKIDFEKILNAKLLDRTQLKHAVDLMKRGKNVDSLLICNFDVFTLKKVVSAIEMNIDISPYLTKYTESEEAAALIVLLKKKYIISKRKE